LGRSHQPEIAHDIAIKSAETDATKRALATFGNAFGLALYDPEQSQVTRLRKSQCRTDCELVLTSLDGRETPFPNAEAFTQEVLRQVDGLATIADLYEFWAANAPSLKILGQDRQASELAQRIITSLKYRARQIAQDATSSKASPEHALVLIDERTDSSYLLPNEKRLRDRAHLEFVATQPCLICGRHPTQAHHVRFSQPRAMALKVSDEFTVPLCNTHHDQLHRSGDERAFWARNGVPDPLKHAARLWSMSRRSNRTMRQDFDPDSEQEFNEPNVRKRQDRSENE
jgi:hypothetical protein